MERYTQFLERMASISPGVHLHIAGKLWQQQIDEDEATPDALTVECFSVMIDEAFELGLEFDCTRADLCASYYDLDKTLLFFEVVFPTPLYRSIAEDDGFRLWLTTTVCDGAGDPDQGTAMNLLTYLAYEHPRASRPLIAADAGEDSAAADHLDVGAPVFEATYQLLHDKLRSTPVFDAYVASILAVHAGPIEVPIDPDEQAAYLELAAWRIGRLRGAADHLLRAMPEQGAALEPQYARIETYKVIATAADDLARNTWAYVTNARRTTDVITPQEQALLARFNQEQNAQAPLFEAYFRLRGEPLTRTDCASIILGCYDETITKDAFIAATTAAFDRLKDLLPPADPRLHVFIQTACLTLAGKFDA